MNPALAVSGRTTSLETAAKALALASLFCLAFDAARALLRRDLDLVFLAWNLLLAWIPWWCAAAAVSARPLKRALLLAAWLAFLPNAHYVVTDLKHVHHAPDAMNWVDLMVVVSFAWTSAMLGFGSVVVVQHLVSRARGAAAGWAAAIGALALSGFGVYLGRFRRWNTWDTLLDPRALLVDVWAQVRHPLHHLAGTSFSIAFAGFAITTYLTLIAISHLRSELALEAAS